MEYFSSHHDAIHSFHTLERLVERLSGQFTRRLFTMPGASIANYNNAPVRSSTRNRLLPDGLLVVFFNTGQKEAAINACCCYFLWNQVPHGECACIGARAHAGAHREGRCSGTSFAGFLNPASSSAACSTLFGWLADYQQFISSRFWSASFYFLPYPPSINKTSEPWQKLLRPDTR